MTNITRLAAVDLFAGAGGLSLGFEWAGFAVPLAVERDDWAADTYERNRPDSASVKRGDIAEISDMFFTQYRGVDVVMGGPPCQGFSISASNRRNPDDPRNSLYRHFLRAVSVIRPRVVVIENVKEILRARLQCGMLLDDMCAALAGMGYGISYRLLHAVEYGVPQNRLRFFLVAGLNDVSDVLYSELFEPLPQGTGDALTLWDAISDLPAVSCGMNDEEMVLRYDKPAVNSYQMRMRGEEKAVYNHLPMRHTKRILDRFRQIPIGGGLTNISAEHGARRRGQPDDLSGVVYGQNHRRPDPDKPAPTITASFYSSFVHPYEHRNFTVREAARIQSFPDYYRFYGKRTTLSKKLLVRKGIHEDLHLDQFNQVGNAVPPLLAEGLARRIVCHLGEQQSCTV